MTDKTLETELRKLPTDGYLWLNIRAENTERNEEIFKEFKEFARFACGDNYTLTLERLLDYYRTDAKVERIWEAINEIKTKIEMIEATLVEPKKEDEEKGGAF